MSRYFESTVVRNEENATARVLESGAVSTGGGFSPTDIPGLVVWLDPDDAVVSGGNITSIVNKGSGPNPTVMGTPHVSTMNGHRTFNFDAGAGSLLVDNGSTAMISGNTLSAVTLFYHPGLYGTSRLFSVGHPPDYDWNNPTSFSCSVESSKFPSGYRDGVMMSTLDIEHTMYHSLVSVFNGTDHRIWVDDVAGTPVASTGVFDAKVIGVGGAVMGSDFFEGACTDFLMYSGALTSTDRTNLLNWLLTKYARKLPCVDNFDRADGTAGGNWIGRYGRTPAISSNHLVSVDNSENRFWHTAPCTTNKQFAQATCNVPTGQNLGGLSLCGDPATDATGYEIRRNTFGGQFDFVRNDSWQASWAGSAEATNDIWRMESKANASNAAHLDVIVKRNGTEVYRYTDTTPLTGLYCGGRVEGFSGGTYIDNWSHGDLLVSSGPLYSDNFNRTDGAVGAPWVGYEGTHYIVGNKVANGTGAPTVSYYDQPISNDQWVEFDVDWNNSGIATPCIRVNGTTGDLYYLWCNFASPTYFTINKRVAGSYSQIADGGNGLFTVVPTGTFKARFEAEGTTLRLYIEGALVWSGIDTSIPTGKPGMLGPNSTGVGALDNFRAGDLPYVPSTGGTSMPMSASGASATGGSAALLAKNVITASGATTSDGAVALLFKNAISASGTGASVGTATTALKNLITASGTGLSGGTVDITLRSVTISASGTGTSLGTAAFAIKSPMTASGLDVSDGTAAFLLKNAITASGTGASTGSASFAGTTFSASGASLSDGSATLLLKNVITASGTGTFLGVATLTTKNVTSASGTGTSTGTATIAQQMLTSASGVSASSGSAVFAPIVMTASGTGLFGGTATLISKLVITASGPSVTGGTASISTGSPMAASGSGLSTGSAALTITNGPIAHQMSASGTGLSIGTATTIHKMVVSASGTGLFTGSVALGLKTPITASGPILSGGTATIAQRMVTSASGDVGLFDGSAKLLSKLVMRGVGSGLTTGSVALILGGKQGISAGGTGRFGGSVTILIKGDMLDVDVVVGPIRVVEKVAVGFMRFPTSVGAYVKTTMEVGAIRVKEKVTFGAMTARPPVTVGGFRNPSTVLDFDKPTLDVGGLRADSPVTVGAD